MFTIISVKTCSILVHHVPDFRGCWYLVLPIVVFIRWPNALPAISPVLDLNRVWNLIVFDFFFKNWTQHQNQEQINKVLLKCNSKASWGIYLFTYFEFLYTYKPDNKGPLLTALNSPWPQASPKRTSTSWNIFISYRQILLNRYFKKS